MVRVRPPSQTAYRLETLTRALRLPVDAVPLDDTGALLVVALDGAVLRYEDGQVAAEPFLSLAGRVTGLLGEQGFFSIALEPPARADARGGDRYLYATFTEAGTNAVVVAAYPLLRELSGADRAREIVLIRQEVEEPFHHGGQVAFGPDGMLYVSIGDGQRDVSYLLGDGHVSRDPGSLRGKVLRIDPLPPGATEGDPYEIPHDNPYASGGPAGARGEVWASGFRNPWKFTFAPSDSAMLLSDVGEDRWEEIDEVVRGGDHGWPAREGPECLRHPETGALVVPDCETLSLVPPAAYYGHPAIDPTGGKSVVGGVEVHDPSLPALSGAYVFGDFITGRLWALDRSSGEVELLLEQVGPISGIVNGPDGEVLVLSIDGAMSRLLPAE